MPYDGKSSDGKIFHMREYSFTWPFGQKDSTYCLTGSIKQKLYPIQEKDLQYTITISGNALETADEKYEGHYIYTKSGKDITKKFSGNTIKFFGFGAKTIKYCEVHKISGTQPISLKIEENDKVIFKSPKISDQPIVYNNGQLK